MMNIMMLLLIMTMTIIMITIRMQMILMNKSQIEPSGGVAPWQNLTSADVLWYHEAAITFLAAVHPQKSHSALIRTSEDKLITPGTSILELIFKVFLISNSKRILKDIFCDLWSRHPSLTTTRAIKLKTR